MADIFERMQAIETAETANFLDLVKIAQLSPEASFQYANLRGMDFSGCDLEGFNFAGSALHGSDFTGAQIAGAFFDCAQLELPELQTAADYAELIELSRERLPKDSDRRNKSYLETLMVETLRSASPEVQIPRHLPQLPAGKTVLVAIGKQAPAAARAIESHWSGPLEGIVLTPRGMGQLSSRFEVIEAGYPVPDHNVFAAAAQIFDLISDLSEDDLLILVLTSGASALMAAPLGEITLGEFRDVHIRLLMAGAAIDEMNLVRSYLTAFGSGRLAKDASPARIATLIMQDGPAEGADGIGHSPTTSLGASGATVMDILRSYNVEVSPSIRSVLDRSDLNPPEADDPCFQNVTENIVTSWDALPGLVADAGVLPDTRIVDLGFFEGSTHEVAQNAAETCRALLKEKPSHPLMLVSTGETVAQLAGNSIGDGGRNSEFLLNLAIALDGLPGVSAIAVDTEGRDGSMDAAGAFISPATLARASASNLDPHMFLQRNGTAQFFAQLDDLVVTGPTGVKLGDLRLVLIEPTT
ncbi:glycerate 2-kinase [Labrenzia sp. MBR-25]